MKPVRCLLLIGVLCATAAPAVAWSFEELTAEQTKSVERASKWIIKAQNANGSWGCDLKNAPDVSATCCAALALIAGGTAVGEGPDADSVRAVQKAVSYILGRVRSMRPGADIAEGERSDIQTYVGQRVHSVFALMLLSQVYGAGHSEFVNEEQSEIKSAILKLCDVVAGAQEADGSWYKDTYSSLQATAWAFTALRATNACGIEIRHATIPKTLQFIRNRYDASSHLFNSGLQGQGANPIYSSAAGLRVIDGMGLWNSPEYSKCSDALLNMITRPPGDQNFLTNTGEDFMASVLISHALIKEQGPHWEQWFTFCRNRLTRIQNADGSWTATSCLSGRTFPTAFAMLTLQTPNRVLPMQDL